MSSHHSSGGPPSDNPILHTYETFHRETPFVTRTIITTQAFSWALSFFVDLTFSLANIPIFTILHYEIYRILTSIFLCTNFLSLAFAYFSFIETGKRLENSIGSTEFSFLCLSIGVLTNILYCAVGALLDALFGTQYFFYLPSFGVWLVLFGLTAFECIKAPQGSTRRLFVLNIPTKYYPLALLGVFSLIGGFSLAYLISIGIGYLYGLDYLDCLKVSSSRCRAWEESFLESNTHSEGWVPANAAMGSGAWNEEQQQQQLSNQGTNAGGFASMLSEWTAQAQQQQRQSHPSEGASLPMGSEDSRPGRVIKSPLTSTASKEAASSTDTMMASGGRQLGGPSRRTNMDPRQARLKAIERRMGAASNNDPNQVI
jgi:membrane associated rhomboid family serine protease